MEKARDTSGFSCSSRVLHAVEQMKCSSSDAGKESHTASKTRANGLRRTEADLGIAPQQ